MFSKNLIVAGILAATLASADVPLSVQHDATNSLAESVGIASTRNLRAMTEQTALGATAAQALLCANIGTGNGQLASEDQLRDLALLGPVEAEDIQSCCGLCSNSILCVAFDFQPLLSLEACILSRSRTGRRGNLIDLVDLVDLSVGIL